MRRRQLMGKRGGSTLLETAVVLPVLLLLTIILTQYGLVYNSVLTLNNMAREGARFAAVRAKDLGDGQAGRDALKEQVRAYLKKRSQGTSIAPTMLDPDAVPGDPLRLEAPKIESNAPLSIVIRYNLIKNKTFGPGLAPLPSNFAKYEASAVNLIE